MLSDRTFRMQYRQGKGVKIFAVETFGAVSANSVNVNVNVNHMHRLKFSSLTRAEKLRTWRTGKFGFFICLKDMASEI
jgi:hypothetical protein